MMPRTTTLLMGGFLLGCAIAWAMAMAGPVAEDKSGEPSVAGPGGPALLPSGPSAENPPDKTPSVEGPVGKGPALDPAPAETEEPAEKDAASEGDKHENEPRKEVTPEKKPADAPTADESKPERTAEPPPKRTLTPTQTALRDKVRRTLALHRKQPLNLREHTVTDILHACLAFGCETDVLRDAGGGQKVNGITALCWNYPCGGFVPLMLSDGHIAARVGYGLQDRPGQLLAVLAMARVPANYPLRAEKEVRTVADLVEAEKLACFADNDLSLRLIGLAYYCEEPTWKNGLGEEWSIERMVQEEMSQPIAAVPDGGMSRLVGLSFALDRRAKHKQPIDGQFQRARQYLGDLHARAMSAQNTDGSWGPYLLSARGASRDPSVQLRCTGLVLEWLALSLPAEQLDDPRTAKAVEYLSNMLGSQRYVGTVRAMSTLEIGSVMHALHALAICDDRCFKPAE